LRRFIGGGDETPTIESFSDEAVEVVAPSEPGGSSLVVVLLVWDALENDAIFEFEGLFLSLGHSGLEGWEHDEVVDDASILRLRAAIRSATLNCVMSPANFRCCSRLESSSSTHHPLLAWLLRLAFGAS
jgi:hypothetical protein